MKQHYLTTLLCILAFACTNLVIGQGVTSSAVKGKVTDAKGEPIFAANVVAEHVPSGTQYGTITQEDGRFNIRNMRVGGPYKVSVSFIGYHTAEQDELYLQLNKTLEIDIMMTESVESLDEVVITYYDDGLINSDRTGAVTNVNEEQIKLMPTIARSQKDLTRLTPQSDGNSFGGRNNLYNNFSLDGSIFNNSFGLDYATPGGQADAQPVSLDAIEQVQVSLAPYDVREGGFTGAGVNAVTRSGTNEFRGTAYFYFRNDAMLGNKIGDVKSENIDFNANQWGVSVGGPIVKNKLFFFMNFEGERRDGLAHGYVAQNDQNAGDENVTSVMESDIMAVQQHYREFWGYEPGAYQGYNHKTYNNKFLVKLDWNISQKHKLTLRYNMLDAWKDILPHPEAIIGRGPTSYRLPFENSSYRIFNKIHSVVGEFNSLFSSKVSNNLLVGYTAFRDERDPHSEPFPVVDIFDANGNLAITAGSEMFSTHNRLYQDVWQFTDNVTIYLDKHTLTAGVNFERFYFENSFNLFYYPWHTFMSVEDFLSNNAFSFNTGEYYTPDFNQDVVNSQKNEYMWAYVDVGQLAFYLQDEFQANDKLNLTFGLRTDIPIYLNKIEQTEAVQQVIDFDGWVDEEGNPKSVNPSEWPKSVFLWSPRFGFNWDIKGDKTLQLRGGTGIFTGRIPFVWLGNQASNPGINPGYTFQVNATTEKFKWPQVWKTDLAIDHKWGDGWFASFEGMFAKDINAVVHRNYNMLAPTGQLSGTGDNRPSFAGFNEVNIYSSSTDYSFLEAGTIILDNTDEGYQYSLTGRVGKEWHFGLSGNLAYTYMDSRDYTSIPAEIAADAFQRNPVAGSPNNPALSWSRYGLQHRIISSWFYTSSYSDRFATSVGFFIEAAEGARYSYVYAGDLNGDMIVNNDLLYVPNGPDDIHFGTVDENGVATPAADADAQWAALDAFIEQDNYLKERRGQYAERHGAKLPWFYQIDLRLLQDFSFYTGGKKNTFQLSFDILNLPNLLNSNWGVYHLPRTTTPISVTGVDANGVPYMQFDQSLTESYIDDFSNLSRWQLQIGIRYIFN
jgi:hypothetical protein